MPSRIHRKWNQWSIGFSQRWPLAPGWRAAVPRSRHTNCQRLPKCFEHEHEGTSYSFTPPEVRPPTINLWQIRNIAVIGNPLRTANAANRPHSFSCSARKELAPTANVQLERVCRTMDATGYSDIKDIKERMNTTAKIGRLIGKSILTKVWN